MCDGPISIYPGRSAANGAAIPFGAHQSIEVRRREERGAGKRCGRAQMRRTRRRWRGSRNSIACGSSNSGGGANNTVFASAMTAQIAQASSGDGRNRCGTRAAGGLIDRVGGGEAAQCRTALRRLNGRRRLRGDGVEMPERQPKLQRQRQQRQPRAVFDVRPKPLHADRRPASGGPEASRPPRCYNITSGIPGPVNGGRSGCRHNSEGLCDLRNARRAPMGLLNLDA